MNTSLPWRSPVKDVEIKKLLISALTDRINDRSLFMKGIDVSYFYEGYSKFKPKISELIRKNGDSHIIQYNCLKNSYQRALYQISITVFRNLPRLF